MNVVHYRGEIRTAKVLIVAGWAACCCGERAVTIKRNGTHSDNRAEVTCKRCLVALRKHDEWAETKRLVLGLEAGEGAV